VRESDSRTLNHRRWRILRLRASPPAHRQKSGPYSLASRERSRGTFWLPRWTVPADSGGAWPRSLPCCPVPAAHRRSVWITRPVGRVGPGEPSAPGSAAYARRSGPSHRGCLQFLGLDGPVSVTAAGW